MLSSKKDINQQLHDTIYKKVTKKTHNHKSPKKNGDGTIKKCIELFKQGADPKVLIRLEKSLKEQEESYNYYTKKFLPVLETEVMKLEVELSVSNNEREQLQRSPTRRGKILEIISGIIKRSSNKDSKIEEQPINSIKKEIPVSSTGMTENNVESPTKEEVCASSSDSGVSSRKPSEESLESQISSRRSSMSSILSSAGENNDPQKEDTGNQMQPEQAAPEEPQVQESVNSDGQANPDQVKEELSQVSLQRVTEARGEESKIPVSRTGMTDDDHTKDPVKSEEKKDKKNTITTVQKLPVNEKKGEDIPLKQPNNRNLHVALVAGCALSTIGCIVAGAMTSGLVGAGLLAMAAVFAIAAVAELHSNFLSSKLTSINVSPLVDDKELTTCSRL
ncbi:hypothetical protein [Wolbachia endosymbiont (group A) of Tiphia femorata]|uniref:hypothetical protein n=1 Tax=Wolbachia endosymbiont (group A) of Tiphia femorata TaxID=2954063 RepID=UPI002231783A|nr:hypothetical protein [Wolbachia endosymbiont (group A) of Tiphia femorata]